MIKEARIAAFVGNEMHCLQTDSSSREAVLALPLDRLLIKIVKVPADVEAVEFCTSVLQEINPFPDEPLTVSCETVRETEDGRIVIAAALPESSADDIGEALDAQKLNVVRIDALLFGELRSIWSSLAVGEKRKLVVVGSGDQASLLVLDADMPVSVRSVAKGGDLTRETMLSLLEAEEFGGAKPLEEIVLVGDVEFESALAPVRRIPGVSMEDALAGIKERSEEPSSLNALPESWREVLEETRFKAKLAKSLAVSGTFWVLIMGVLFGVPLVYGFMADKQKSLSRAHRSKHSEVSGMREKVKLVQKYSDHSRGALEIMKALSDRLPEGIELGSWNFERENADEGRGGVTVSGEADSANLVYEFKDEMSELKIGDEKLFGTVNLRGPTAGRGGKQRFDLECRFAAEEGQ